MIPQKLDYKSVLATFNIEHKACLYIKEDGESKVPKINDKDNDRKIDRWSPIFKECLSNSHGSRGTLICVLLEDPTVTDEIVDPLLAKCYCGKSGSLISKL